MAATSIGAIATPLNSWWGPSELGNVLSDARPTIFVCDEERWHRWQQWWNPISAATPHVLPRLPELTTIIVVRTAENYKPFTGTVTTVAVQS